MNNAGFSRNGNFPILSPFFLGDSVCVLCHLFRKLSPRIRKALLEHNLAPDSFRRPGPSVSQKSLAEFAARRRQRDVNHFLSGRT